jgi:hypothetical protein
MKFSMTGKVNGGHYNRGDYMGRFDYTVKPVLCDLPREH